MIKSITFDGKSGYITKTIPEPECSVRGYGMKGYSNRRWTEDEQNLIDDYKKKHRLWARHKDEYLHPELVKNLVGRKIEFQPGKINLIFGPNASGKTTILKALAGNSGTTDGYPKLTGPLDLRAEFGKPITSSDMRRYLNNMMCNSADIEWDGAPIYYDNFSNRQNHGSLGDLCGSVLGDDVIDEIAYVMTKSRISLGQNTIYLLNKLFAIAEKHLCYADIFSGYVNPDGSFKKMKCNDIWETAYKIQLSYYMGFEKSLVKSPGTFLFDELDKSLDIANIHELYTNVLPELVKKTGIQVIIISHSPLVLSNKIRNNEMYNFISIDDEYTNDCVNTLGKLF